MSRRDDTRQQVEDWKRANPPLAIAERAGEVKHSGSTPMIHCLWHEDTTPSMAVYEDGFYCFACGKQADVVEYLMQLNGWDFRQFIDFIGQYPVNPQVPQPIREQPRPAREQPAIAREQVEGWADNIMTHLDWWQAQHIHPATLLHFGVGWTGQRYSIPWTYRGVVTAVKLRRCEVLTPHLEPKYMSLKGSHFSQPYNIDAVLLHPGESRRLLIVEDEKSVWAAYQWGLTAISAPAGSFKPQWVVFVGHIPDIIIVADADEPGREAARRIQGWIRRARVVEANAFYPDGRPATDLFDLHAAGIDIVEYLDARI